MVLAVAAVAGAYVMLAVCMLYCWAQRSFVTGRCIHWSCERRSKLLVACALTCALVMGITLLAYEAKQEGLFGEVAKQSTALCHVMFWESHVSVALYVAPYLLRTFRVAALYRAQLRQRLWCVATSR